MLKKITLAMLIVSLLLPAVVMAGTINLPQTGQTTTYATGDDGAIEAG
ncbi:secreted protein, partial [Candidatus Magnetobacterium bavaricum]